MLRSQALVRFSREVSRQVTTRSLACSDTTAASASQARSFIPSAWSAQAEATTDSSAPVSPPKIVVFGGNGYVGSAVCQAVLKLGLDVTSISRSAAPLSTGEWVKEVDWVKGDALKPEGWRDQLNGAAGVISCVGAFGSNEYMEKVCGDATVEMVKAAAEAKVPRFVFISAHDYGPAFKAILRGYVEGKYKAEAAIKEYFPDSGVYLRPGFVHGTRQISASASIPLGLIGGPLEKILRGDSVQKLAMQQPLLGPFLVPPTSVEDVASAAVNAATDLSVPAGPMDVWTIPKYA